MEKVHDTCLLTNQTIGRKTEGITLERQRKKAHDLQMLRYHIIIYEPMVPQFRSQTNFSRDSIILIT